MGIGTIYQSPELPLLGTPIADVIASGGVRQLTSVDAVQQAGMNVTQGNNQPPAWQGDNVTGRMAPEVPGGLHYAKVILVTTGQPVPLRQSQQDQE